MSTENLRARPLPWNDILLSSLLAIMLIGGLLAGVFAYHSLRAYVARSKLPIFTTHSESPPVSTSPQESEAEEVAEPSEPVEELTEPVEENQPLPPAATERLTVLVMGIDRREDETGPFRTDSMILISIDPTTDSIAMLSMPRDLYVTLPDYGYGEHLQRINTAHFFGDLREYPGGGPALAKQTIRRNFGVEVDRYVVLDFDGFRQIIDHIGGIEIDVPEPIIDTQYPTEDYGVMTVRFEAGKQTMNGERALIYSRTRKSTSDFARAERQQHVILAVRDKVLSLDILSSLTPANLARILATVEDSIVTDMSLDELLAFAQVARRIEEDNIHRLLIDANLVIDYTTYTGDQVLLPRWKEILPLIEETFGVELLPIAPTPTPPPPPPTPTPTPEIVETPTPSAATVMVLNGTDVASLESNVAAGLQQGGFNVVGYGLAERADYARSRIVVNNPEAAATAELLRQRYGLAPADVQVGAEGGVADIVFIVGAEMAGNSGGEGAPPPAPPVEAPPPTPVPGESGENGGTGEGTP